MFCATFCSRIDSKRIKTGRIEQTRDFFRYGLFSHSFISSLSVCCVHIKLLRSCLAAHNREQRKKKSYQSNKIAYRILRATFNASATQQKWAMIWVAFSRVQRPKANVSAIIALNIFNAFLFVIHSNFVASTSIINYHSSLMVTHRTHFSVNSFKI